MGRLSCGCLNVQVYSRESDLRQVKPDLGGDNGPGKEFFNQPVAEIHLNLEGIKIEHGSLVRSYYCAEWKIHQCINCKMHTHATRGNSILVNMQLLCEVTNITQLQNSPEYSTLYHIVLKDTNDNQPIPTLNLRSGKQESLQKNLTTVQQKLNDYLMKEEASMENKIRQFEEEERNKFSELQRKAKREKSAVVRLLLSAQQEDLRMSLSDAMNDAPPSPVSPDIEGSHDLSENTSSSPAHSTMNKDKHKLHTQMSLPAPRRQHSNHFQLDETDDVLFDLDGFEEDGSQPFYESDEENGDTDDSSLEDREKLRLGDDPKMFYSTSVPITVPNWNNNVRNMLDGLDQDEFPRDAETMAASIQALARSVHGDGTEMFGELPRSRKTPYFNKVY